MLDYIPVIIFGSSIIFGAGVLYVSVRGNSKKIYSLESRFNNCVTTLRNDIGEIKGKLGVVEGYILRNSKEKK